jgi:hypothetical protein
MILNLFAELTSKIDEVFISIFFQFSIFEATKKAQIFGLRKEQCKVLIGLSEQ